jgi:hypothetical protein
MLVTVTGGGVVVVGEDDPPHPLSARPSNSIADNRDSTKEFSGWLFRVPTSRGRRVPTEVRSTLMLSS